MYVFIENSAKQTLNLLEGDSLFIRLARYSRFTDILSGSGEKQKIE